MPKSQHLNPRPRYSVVKRVANPREVDAPNSFDSRVQEKHPDLRLAGNQREGALDLHLQHAGSIRAIPTPPVRCRAKLADCARRQTDWKRIAQPRRRLRNTTAASISSPRSASAIASRSSASCSGVSSKLSESSAAMTATGVPSSKGSPSRTTLPATIFPVATRIIKILRGLSNALKTKRPLEVDSGGRGFAIAKSS